MRDFGACCEELLAGFDLPEPNFWIDDEGVLYLATGWMESGEGRGNFYSAMMFCPFCGKSLQTADKIRYQSLGPA